MTAVQLRFVLVLVVPEADRPVGAFGDVEHVAPVVEPVVDPVVLLQVP